VASRASATAIAEVQSGHWGSRRERWLREPQPPETPRQTTRSATLYMTQT